MSKAGETLIVQTVFKRGIYMGLKQIANGKAREYVLKREPFKGSNLFADTNEHGMYTVYSFGYHHPLFVYDGLAEQWYENMTYASRTTSRHRTQTRPNGEDMIPLHLEDMLVVARCGAVGLIEVAEAQSRRKSLFESASLRLAQGINGTLPPTKMIMPPAIVQLAEKIAKGDDV